jgi:LysM repeat protein
MATVMRVFRKRIALTFVVGATLLLAVACTQNTLTCAEGNMAPSCRVPFGNNPDQVTGSIRQPRVVERETIMVQPPVIDRPAVVRSPPLPWTPSAITARRQTKFWKPVRVARQRRATTCDVTGSIPAGGARAFPLLSDAHWERDERNIVTVESGDTLRSLSHRYGVPEAALREANALGRNEPRPGDRIMIPHYNIYPVTMTPRPEATTSVTIRTGARPITHVVWSGETLSSIARHYGTSVAEIARFNGIEPGARIKSGAAIEIPRS